MNLEDWREEIDNIDRELVRLIEKRIRVVRKIGAIKVTAGLPARDKRREEAVMRNICAASDGIAGNVGIVRIYSEILRQSKEIQRGIIETALKQGAGAEC